MLYPERVEATQRWIDHLEAALTAWPKAIGLKFGYLRVARLVAAANRLEPELTAMDEAAHRITSKWLLADRRDIYMTQELSAGPNGGSRVRIYVTFEEANPEFQQRAEGMLQASANRLKAFCEANARSS